MCYKTLKDLSTESFEEKKSTFIGSAKRVETEVEAKEFINSIKAQNREARHNVYAYIIGQKSEIQRYSDDGEPQGTGGIPVLEVIKKNNITDAVVVVTRYFGGILLGASGLCRAYSRAAAMAVKSSGSVEKVKAVVTNAEIEYDMLGKLQYKFDQNNWQILNVEYGEKVIVNIISEVSRQQEIVNAVIDMTANKVKISSEKEGYYFKENDTILDSI
ncbi:YigZ family protein [Clostridium oryzae]|uniref:IMPACT family member YigZ n=1 Tax=Clostridium oryzae TaxID=1450648 RepID=A0A1V4IU49_9CLOT|nr:YigZ family protein [Clostridium oryzae]OPJ63571.1 IMPACT family member YigZ [Clostridium oryzae]